MTQIVTFLKNFNFCLKILQYLFRIATYMEMHVHLGKKPTQEMPKKSRTKYSELMNTEADQ